MAGTTAVLSNQFLSVQAVEPSRVRVCQEARPGFSNRFCLLAAVEKIKPQTTRRRAYRMCVTAASVHQKVQKMSPSSRSIAVGAPKAIMSWERGYLSGRASAFRLACPLCQPMGEFIEDATEYVDPRRDPEKEWPVYGVNNNTGVLLNCYQKGKAFKAKYKRIRKDLFFHNPTRCNVGSLGVVPDVPRDAITSPEYQVWHLKTGIAEPLLSDFVAALIRTPFFISLIQFNRVGAVKQRMTENLCELRIPYLSVPEQQTYARVTCPHKLYHFLS